MKLTPIQIVMLWNVINDLQAINDGLPGAVSVFIRRFMVYARPEVNIWNDLKMEERALVKDQQISLPVKKVKTSESKKMNYTSDMVEALNLMFCDPLPEKKSNLEQLLDKS